MATPTATSTTLPCRTLAERSLWVKNPSVAAAEQTLWESYADMTEQYPDWLEAQESVVFHTPCIICDDWLLERLEAICDTVPDVTVMTNSVANNGNPFGASDYSLNKEKIRETGVQILEYDGGISCHGKCFVIDERLSGWKRNAGNQRRETCAAADHASASLGQVYDVI
ncbi:MAG: hypothetical protein LIO86_10335 [Lachnospiraceae bacterium]|nr:hypothetical protein [Lachnospiraceae bacterium]